VFIPASGWLADRFGTRDIFRTAIIIFTLGSVLCGRAEGLPFLVGSRILQGLGGALMVPVGRLVLLRTVPKSQLVDAMAWLTVPSLVGPIIGPPIGGFIVTYTSWRWIFDINVPIGIVGLLLVSFFVPNLRRSGRMRFDALGLLWCGLALAALMSGLELLSRPVGPSWLTPALLVGGALAGLVYLRHARRLSDPLLDLALLRIPTFGVSALAGSFFRIGIGAIPFLLPMMLQLGFGQSAAQSGLITFASSAGALAMKPIASPLLRAVGFRDTLVWNAVLSAGLLAFCAGFRPDWPILAIYAVLLMGGFARSLQFTAYNTIAYADVPNARMSAATSLYTTIQQLSLTLGITVGAMGVNLATWLSGHAAPGTADYGLAFLGVALISLLAAPASLPLAADAGSELTRSRLAP
jgi:EmrB/QacA subfamily drug resistance transporter